MGKRLTAALVIATLVLATLACDLGGIAGPTPHPIYTPYPTYTPIPTPTPAFTSTPMPTPTPTPAPTNTPEGLAIIEPQNAASLRQLAVVDKWGELVFSPDSTSFALGTQEGIYLYQVATLEQIGFLQTIDGWYGSPFGFSPDGQLLAWKPQNGVVKVWGVTSRTERNELSGFTDGCCGKIAFSPDGQLLAILDGHVARLWDVAHGREVYLRDEAQDFFFSPDGKMLAFVSSSEIEVTLWEIASEREVRTLSGFSTAAPYYGALFSPDWRTMAWISRGCLQLMDMASGQIGPDLQLMTVSFSPDGRILAAADQGWYGDTYQGEVRLFNVVSGDVLAILTHEDFIPDMTFSPDGRILAAADKDTVTLWDVANGQKLTRLTGHTATVWSATFSPDGRLLASVGEDGSVRLWGIPE